MAIFNPTLSGTAGTEISALGFTASGSGTARAVIGAGGVNIAVTPGTSSRTYLVDGANAPNNLQDQEIEFEVNTAGGLTELIILRYSTQSNYIYLRSAGTGGRIYVRKDATANLVVPSVTTAPNTRYIFRVQDNVISIIRKSDNFVVTSYTDTDRTVIPTIDGYPGLSVGSSTATTIDPWITYFKSNGVGESSADTTPDSFNFTRQDDVNRNTYIVSNSITVSGINTSASISITDGQYEINNSGNWTSTTGTVSNGDTVRVRCLSSISFLQETSTTLNIGGVTSTFITKTGATETHNFNLRVTDNLGNIANLPVSITTEPQPTLSALGGTFSLPENAIAGDTAGTITNTTPDSTLSLINDASGRVALSGSSIVRGLTPLDYETASSHTFIVRETLVGSSNSPRDTTLTLTVTDINEAPTSSIQYGRTSNYDAGSTGNFYVSDSTGNDANLGTSIAAPKKTINAAIAAASPGHSIKVLAGTYKDPILLNKPNIKLSPRGTDTVVITGGENLTGWTRCTSADQAIVGANYNSIFKVTINKSLIQHTAYYAVLMTEAGTILELVQQRRDESNLFEINASGSFFRVDKGDTLTLGYRTNRIIRTNTRSTDTTDGLGKSAVTSIIGVNQGGTWNGSSFTGGTNYVQGTDYVLDGISLSWAPGGAEPAAGTTYTVVFDHNVIDTISHPAVLGNGTTPYTDAQLANCAVMFLAYPNASVALEVDSAVNGVLHLETNLVEADINPSGGAYSLMNILPHMSQGQWGYMDTGGSTITFYCWPNSEANLASGMWIAARSNCLDIPSATGCTVEGFIFQHCSDSAFGIAMVRATNADGLVFKENLLRQYSHKDGGYGAAFFNSCNNLIFEKNEIEDGQNQYGLFSAQGAYDSPTGVRVRYNKISRTSQSGFRFYGQKLCAVYFNKAVECGLGAHANKINFYEGCDQILVMCNIFENCSGYATNQEASRMLWLNNIIPTDPTGGYRAYADQTHKSDKGPTDPSNNYHINNHFPVDYRSLQGYHSVVLGAQYWSMYWYVYNNVMHGLIDDPDYPKILGRENNLLTFDDPVGPNEESISNRLTVYFDPDTNDWRTVPNSKLRTKTGKDVNSIITMYESWFPDVNLRVNFLGESWNPSTPGVGPYGPNNWPIATDNTAPVLSTPSVTLDSSNALVSVSTSEKGGKIYWVQVNSGSGQPTVAQIVAGLNSTGTAAKASGSIDVLNSGTQPAWVMSGTSPYDLYVVHIDRHTNSSNVAFKNIAFTAWSPTWVQFDSVTRLKRSTPIIGANPQSRAFLAAFSIKKTAPELTTSGYLLSSGLPSTRTITITDGSTSKIAFTVEPGDNRNANLFKLITGTSMAANTEYLVLASYTSSSASGYTGRLCIINIATGALLGSMQSIQGVDTYLTLADNTGVLLFDSNLSAERVMLWDNATADITQATTRQLFVGATGGLINPSVAAASLGTPLINISGAMLSVGVNIGTGGDFSSTSL